MTLIGHSYGGLVSIFIHYLKINEGLEITFNKLILIDSPAYPDARPFFLTAIRNPILSFIGLKIFSPRWNARYIIKKTFYDKNLGLRKFPKRYTFFFDLDYYDEAMKGLAKQITPNDYEEIIKTYKDFEVPTLILWGKHDRLIPLKFGERLNKDIKNSTLKIIEKCGHVPHEEKPAITYNLINEFLNNK